MWRRKFPQGSYGIVFDPAGDLIMGDNNACSSPSRRFARATTWRWRRKLRGNSYNGGSAVGVAVDGTGAVFATGGHVAPPIPKGHVNGLPSYTVVRVCGANGRIHRTDACP